jgi:glutathione S-transferase
MLKLWHAPRTRSVRIVWLLEELGLDYELERVEFAPTSDRFFQQQTPLGKLPVLEDGQVLLCESGAIVEYVLERYGDGRLAPDVAAPERARYLQWLHFSEATAFPPIGNVVWLTRYRDDGDSFEELVAAARDRAASGLAFLEEHFGAGPFIVGKDFTAADVMLGFTLAAALTVDLLDHRYPVLGAYLGRLMERPALQTALAA